MSANADLNWWSFSIDSDIRLDKTKSKLEGELEINRELTDGRRALDYRTYLGLSKLLQCQVPSSRVPDERVFLVVHQLFELVFKLMIFDLAIIAETFNTLSTKNDIGFFLSSEEKDEKFWRPALTASRRIRFSAEEMLSRLMAYLGNGEGKLETFNSIEFYYFRSNLEPASGFQTAQFRLIQRAFGKSNLLSVRLFPGETYWKNYGGKEDGPVTVVDSLILGGDAETATPSGKSPLELVAQLDELAHQVLSRLPSLGENEPQPSPIRKIEQTNIDSAVMSLSRILENNRKAQEKVGLKPADATEKDKQAVALFKEDFQEAARKENDRREALKAARGGAFYLHCIAPTSYLAQVLNGLVSADDNLHGRRNSFLHNHFKVARDRINEVKEHARSIGQPEPPSGTGGGGIEYLGYSMKDLLPLFPALIACRDLEDSPVFSWIDEKVENRSLSASAQ